MIVKVEMFDEDHLFVNDQMLVEDHLLVKNQILVKDQMPVEDPLVKCQIFVEDIRLSTTKHQLDKST